MHIEIETTNTSDRQVTARRSGEVFFIREQQALMFKTGQKYPDKFTLNIYFGNDEKLRNATGSLPVGRYQFAEEAFYINNNQQMALNPSRLQPLKAAQAA
ncbi:hypothetical protein C9927_04180 [Pseudidiomarina aestuarii]|uniref:Uncharacterized protein n=1 Tax=Pseudidiomarina aestuarii TaxID=624146 RepID=A0A2T4D3U2_9GAMM|nr:hypothetical protein C9927_04180 [Pseudidiomarina aestuarii]